MQLPLKHVSAIQRAAAAFQPSPPAFASLKDKEDGRETSGHRRQELVTVLFLGAEKNHVPRAEDEDAEELVAEFALVESHVDVEGLGLFF